ncbi:BrnT family toxin [archaeon]|nr:MAG: BrnT family toxin [archaeon]
MDFDFDPKKSASNREKHGIDFIKAQALLDDPNLIEIPAHVTDEPRLLVIGRIAETHCSGVITYRDDLIRIISVRRSRKEEIDLYES